MNLNQATTLLGILTDTVVAQQNHIDALVGEVQRLNELVPNDSESDTLEEGTFA